MYEFHGWATIRESTRDIDEGNLSAIVEKLNQQILSFKWNVGVLEIKPINGAYHLIASGFTNHKSPDATQVFSLFQKIAETAKGSYGLLHVWDDENAKESNQFSVWMLARGAFLRQDDPFLSPCVPKIEDPG